jgi:hypothetical protein
MYISQAEMALVGELPVGGLTAILRFSALAAA